MGRRLDVASSYAASVLRLGLGWSASAIGPRPSRPIELWEFEGCPFSRKVREALTVLDLEAVIHPCPRRGTRHRPFAIERGGRRQFPFMIDHDAGAAMYESSDIVRHLYARYGDRSAPWWMRTHATVPLGTAATLARFARGVFARPSRAPARPLELWSFEISPYCRLVREVLCELELPYLLHSVGKRSPSRAAFVARSGRMMVPYLADPNTGTEMFESADIVRYLEETYALK
jgi:glutathione S-transferase